QKIEQLEGEKRQLQADLFGRRSETKPLNDRSNHLDDPQDDSQQPKRKRGQQPENHGPQRRDYSGLPVREQFVDLPPEQCVCPDCGQPLRLRSDTEDSEQIEIDVRAYRRRLRRRRYERTCTCEGRRTFTAPPPPKLIPKGRYGISLFIEILLDKYFTYRPTERLLNSWRLLGLDLAPSPTACGGWKSYCGRFTRRSSSGILRGICIRAMRRGGGYSSPWKARRDSAGGCGW